MTRSSSDNASSVGIAPTTLVLSEQLRQNDLTNLNIWPASRGLLITSRGLRPPVRSLRSREVAPPWAGEPAPPLGLSPWRDPPTQNSQQEEA